jgi:hypothetical protein
MITPVTSTYQQNRANFQQNHSNTSVDDSRLIEAKGTEIEDTVSISKDAKSKDEEEKKGFQTDEENLDEDQKRQVDKLKKRDQEVKAHERAHMASGGGLVQGGASYTYQKGADGKLYAVGGEVKIDASSERDPDQTIQKMQQVKRAALAPAQPSGTDRAVAARASQIELQAQMQKVQENEGENGEGDENNLDGVQSKDNSSDDVGVQSKDNSSDDFGIQSSDNFSDDNGLQSSENPSDFKGFNPYQISNNQPHSLGHQINISA